MTGDEQSDKLQTMVLQLEQQVRDLQNKLSRVYTERNRCVALAARMALLLGCPAGVGRPDDANEDWAECLYIDLPTGQVSWHFHRCERSLFDDLPHYTEPWDGHSTEQKYRRVAEAFPGEELISEVDQAVQQIASNSETREISVEDLAYVNLPVQHLILALIRLGWKRQWRERKDIGGMWVFVRPQDLPPADAQRKDGR